MKNKRYKNEQEEREYVMLINKFLEDAKLPNGQILSKKLRECKELLQMKRVLLFT